MFLYLVRHGEAKTKEEDPERPLSDEGHSNVKKVAAFLKPNLSDLRTIWQSGKKRAEETARIIVSALAHPVDVLESEGLAPLDPVDTILKAIGELQDDLMLVGHMPFLGELAGGLLAGSGADQRVEFKPAGVMCIKGDENGEWSIEWTANPDMAT